MYKLIIHCFCLFLLLFITACNNNNSQSNITRKIIHTEQAPQAVGPYSQAVRNGNTLYLSGQIGLDPVSGTLVAEDIESQTRQAMDNLRAILEEAGFSLGDVVETQVFLDDLEEYDTFNEIYGSYFEEDPPARVTVEVSRLPLDAKVEIKMTAARNFKGLRN